MAEIGGGGAVTASAWRPEVLSSDVPSRGPALPSLLGVRDATVREFAGLYEGEFGRLAGYLAQLTGDPDAGREAAQEAFTRLFSRWRRVREPRAFVYVVGTNLCRQSWRRAGRERLAVASLARTSPELQLPVDPALRDLVEHLPERLRQVVLLHYYADLPVAEVAAAIGRPVGTVKRRLHEARALLATEMGDPS